MSIAAMLALGARLYDSPDGVTWTELVALAKIGKPSQPTINMISVNSVNPTTRAEEFLPGLVKFGDFEFSQYADPGGSRIAHLRSRLSILGTLTTFYKITLPDPGPAGNPSNWVFAGYLFEAPVSDLEVEKPVTIDCKVRVTLADVFTPAS